MRRRRMKALLYRRKSSVSTNSTSRILTGCSMKPSVVYFTPCSLAGSLKTLPKSKKLSREWNLLGRRMSLQQMYSGEWMGMPSAYWPGLSWGTRPTQLGVTASRFLIDGMLGGVLEGVTALADLADFGGASFTVGMVVLP